MKVVSGCCSFVQPASSRIATIDRRFIVRFPPHVTKATERDSMPHVKLRDGAELYYESRGEGPPLFLVPGLGGDGRFWDANIAGLAKHFTVVVHDHRGTARSTLSKITYSVAQMADELQLIDALGYDKVHWCGHSTGGAMGQVLAIEHPDRIDRHGAGATWANRCLLPPPVRGPRTDAEGAGP
jgi:pimeloyl-ACP methyl ester carboxylesterase